jgi:putative DNA-invertase from lambdoid prophage Rac
MNERAYLGRQPSYSREQLAAVNTMLATGSGASEIAKVVGLSRQTIYRIKAAPGEAEALLELWRARRRAA